MPGMKAIAGGDEVYWLTVKVCTGITTITVTSPLPYSLSATPSRTAGGTRERRKAIKCINIYIN